MLSLQRYFLFDFFLDLVESLQEELLDLRPLVEDDLGQRPHILELLVAGPDCLLKG